jgi:hypothetical protein
MKLSTLSEAMHEKFGRSNCPFLSDCSIPVTKDFFKRVCKSPAYLSCHHYAKRLGELKTPMTWLQKIAIDQSKMLEQGVEAA